MKSKVQKIVLAYSGGLDTSVILGWLRKEYDAEVVAYCADVGQGEELDPVRGKAEAAGACACIIEDLREEFVRDYVFPVLRANATYEAGYLLGTSIARPLIAKRQAEIAREHGADAVAHGATGKGNDQVRFELTFAALAPELTIIVPWREWDFVGREDLIQYAEQNDISIPVSREKPYSCDRNLLHMSFEGGILEDPWREPYDDMFVMTKSPQEAPAEPEYVEIDYEAGDAVAVNGERLSPAALLAKLNELGGKHGVGRIDIVENRYVGMKSRGVYETPGGTILYLAHQAVESLTLDREAMHLRDSLVPRYADMVYNGFWFAPEREMLQALVDESQKPVTGTARMKLYRGNVSIVGRKAARSLYDADIASFDEAGGYQQSDATGFISLTGLRLRMRAKYQG
ncbi:MAG: argininosuccinate synthase [Candidatus Binatia bacterium]|nr:argininosuccinate synthase [Candidatus Binatia bacterium]